MNARHPKLRIATPIDHAARFSPHYPTLNGPGLGTLDGWWLEGCIEGVTGWAVGGRPDGGADDAPEPDRRDADSLYAKLADVVLPCFHRDRDRYLDIMRHAIALNGSFFNTQRMIQQYVLKAYR